MRTYKQSKQDKQCRIHQLHESLSYTTVRTRVLQSQLGMAQSYHSTSERQPGKLPARLHTLFDLKLQPAQHESHATSPTKGQMRLNSEDVLSSSKAGVINPWLRALSVIAGNSLNVIVTGDGSQANALLADPSKAIDQCGAPACTAHGRSSDDKMRLWPLDRLTCSDKTQLQRQAQADLGPGKRVS